MNYAVIPVKGLERAKSRLGSILSAPERVQLCLEMLDHVLHVIAAVKHLDAVVVSRDRRALDLAQGIGVRTLPDRWKGMNASLEGAASWCVSNGAGSLLVVHADLPLLRSTDISAMMKLGLQDRSLVLAPCRHGEGTNAVFMRPPRLIPFAFGPGSFHTYLEMAFCSGLTARVYRADSIALDIDTGEDLQDYRETASENRRACSWRA